MIEKPLRRKLETTAGVLLTRDELNQAIEARKNGVIFGYIQEVPVFLRDTANSAKSLGKLICGRENCELTCAGVSLVDHITPTTLIDGDITAKCEIPDCTGEGVRAAAAYVSTQILTDKL